MANLFDLGLLSTFGSLFPFLFVFIICFAALTMSSIFKENRGLAAVLALVLAVMVLFSPFLTEVIKRMAPIFVIFFIFIIFVLISFMIFGANQDDVMGVLKSENFRYINYWIVAIAILILIGSLTSVWSERGGIGSSVNGDGSTVTSSSGELAPQTQAFRDTLINPKVLGLILVLLIGYFAIIFLTKKM